MKEIEKIIEDNPIGLLVRPEKDLISVLYWQRPAPDGNALWLNMIGGVVNNAVNAKRVTKKEVLDYLETLVK